MLKEGQKAPSFSLVSDSGEKISLNDFKGQRVVLYFYPKDSTPGCTQQAIDFQKALPKFKKLKTVVLGISKDSIESHQKFKDKHGLSFPLLVDAEGKICEAFGVWQEKSLYGRKFMGIVRSTFVIGEDGKIEHIFSKVRVAGHVAELLKRSGPPSEL